MRPLDGNARVEKMTKEFSLAPSFVASALVHLVVLALASTLIGQRSHPNERNSISVALLEPAEPAAARPERTTELPAASGLPPAPGTRETVTARRSPVSVAARARLVYRHQ